jgi:hypothetical protein
MDSEDTEKATILSRHTMGRASHKDPNRFLHRILSFSLLPDCPFRIT